MPKILAIIVAVVLLGGGYLYMERDNEDTPSWNPFRSASSTEALSTAPQTQTTAAQTSAQTAVPDDSHITSYDECIAAGFPPLKDAPDKCLTSGGHLYIKGVVEE